MPTSLTAVWPPQPQEPSPAAPAAEQKSSEPPSSMLDQLQIQLQGMQTSLPNHISRVWALNGIFKEHEAMCTAAVGRKQNDDWGVTQRRWGVWDILTTTDALRSIWTIVLHELEQVEEEDEDRMRTKKTIGEDEGLELSGPRTRGWVWAYITLMRHPAGGGCIANKVSRTA